MLIMCDEDHYNIMVYYIIWYSLIEFDKPWHLNIFEQSNNDNCKDRKHLKS